MPLTRAAIVGLGAIGRALARRLAEGIPGIALVGAVARDREKAAQWLREQGIACPLLDLETLPEHADLAVEAAPAGLLEAICRPMLASGRTVMVLSAGALLPRPDLVELARATGGADHRPDRRAPRARRRHSCRRGDHPQRTDDDPQAAARPDRGAAPGDARHLA